jgi:hypothetical protein
MKNNGHRRAVRDYALEVAVEHHARITPAVTRVLLLARLRRFRRRPCRTFWLLDPTTGDWRLL